MEWWLVFYMENARIILKFGAVVEDVSLDAWTSLSFVRVLFFVWSSSQWTSFARHPLRDFIVDGEVNRSRCVDFCHRIMPNIWNSRLAQVEIYVLERRRIPVANGVETDLCLVDYKPVTYSLNFVYIYEFRAVWYYTALRYLDIFSHVGEVDAKTKRRFFSTRE